MPAIKTSRKFTVDIPRLVTEEDARTLMRLEHNSTKFEEFMEDLTRLALACFPEELFFMRVVSNHEKVKMYTVLEACGFMNKWEVELSVMANTLGDYGRKATGRMKDHLAELWAWVNDSPRSEDRGDMKRVYTSIDIDCMCCDTEVLIANATIALNGEQVMPKNGSREPVTQTYPQLSPNMASPTLGKRQTEGGDFNDIEDIQRQKTRKHVHGQSAPQTSNPAFCPSATPGGFQPLKSQTVTVHWEAVLVRFVACDLKKQDGTSLEKTYAFQRLCPRKCQASRVTDIDMEVIDDLLRLHPYLREYAPLVGKYLKVEGDSGPPVLIEDNEELVNALVSWLGGQSARDAKHVSLELRHNRLGGRRVNGS